METEAILRQIQSRGFFNADALDILTLSRRLTKAEAEIRQALPLLQTKRIALLGSGNLSYFQLILKPFLCALGVAPQFFEGTYNALYSSLLDPNSTFYQYKPEMVFVLLSYREIQEWPALLSPQEAVEQQAQSCADSFLKLFQEFHGRCEAQLFVTNFAAPARHFLGGLEASEFSGRDHFIRLVNERILCGRPAWLHLIDQEALASDFGKRAWFDDSAWAVSKQPFALDAMPLLALQCARLASAAAGLTKKCLVVDLDNTLWGGVIGDDGLDGINLDPNNAVGEAYLEFQRCLLRLKERGVLLAVCSKNEESIARQVFERHPSCLLKMTDFSAFIANWQDKAGNLRAIAASLHITPDALVFFDDNPAERELIRTRLPMVEVIEVPKDPALYPAALLNLDCFDWLQLSDEDLSRSATFQADQQRSALKDQFADYADYLRSLEMRAEMAPLTAAELPRFTQLLNKTNQFNFRTQRYSEAQIETALADSASFLLAVRLADKFSDYGLISALILRKNGGELFIESWVMSCRVFNRGLEDAVMNQLVMLAAAQGCKTLRGEYIQTEKNSLIAALYSKYGFTTEDGKNYTLIIDQYRKTDCQIWLDQPASARIDRISPTV